MNLSRIIYWYCNEKATDDRWLLLLLPIGLILAGRYYFIGFL